MINSRKMVIFATAGVAVIIVTASTSMLPELVELNHTKGDNSSGRVWSYCVKEYRKNRYNFAEQLGLPAPCSLVAIMQRDDNSHEQISLLRYLCRNDIYLTLHDFTSTAELSAMATNDKIVNLSLFDCNGDVLKACCGRLPLLREVSLTRLIETDNNDLQAISMLTNLRSLSLTETVTSGDFITTISHLKIEHLEIRGLEHLSQDSFNQICRITTLRSLSLECSRSFFLDISNLRQLEGLKELYLDGFLTDDQEVIKLKVFFKEATIEVDDFF